jgi:UDP-N-acetyl-D-mannosaminuronic acid dehydrogenase
MRFNKEWVVLKDPRIWRQIKTIGIIGMGYVGIPNALLFANNKETDFVYGIQRESSRSSRKINELNGGKIPFSTYEEEMDVLLQQALDSNKFTCTSNYRNINDCDAVIISVQTPFKNKTEPDYSALESAISETCKHIRPGTLVSIESTITPGYTETIAKPTIQKLSGEPDILLVHAPERVTPGRMLWNIRNLDRVVGELTRQVLLSVQNSINASLQMVRSLKPMQPLLK